MKTTKWAKLTLLAFAALGVVGVFAAAACGPTDLSPQASQPAENANAMALPHERSVLEYLLEVLPDAGIYVSNADGPGRVRTDAHRFSEDDYGSMFIDSEEEYEFQLRWSDPWGESGIEIEYLRVVASGAWNSERVHGE